MEKRKTNGMRVEKNEEKKRTKEKDKRTKGCSGNDNESEKGTGLVGSFFAGPNGTHVPVSRININRGHL